MYIKLCNIICVDVYYSFFCSWLCWHIRGLNCCLRAILALQWLLYLFFHEMEHVRLYRIGGSQTWVLDFELDCSNDIFIFSLWDRACVSLSHWRKSIGFWILIVISLFLSFLPKQPPPPPPLLFFFFFFFFESWLWRIVWCRCVADFGFHSLSTSGFFVFVPFWVEQKL